MLSHLFLYKNVTLIFVIHSFSYCHVKDRKVSSLSMGSQEALSLEIKYRKGGRIDKNEGRERKIMRSRPKKKMESISLKIFIFTFFY